MLTRKYNWMAAALGVILFTGCAAQKTATTKPAADNSGSAEADKVLYERAITDLQHNRFDLARLSMQTLINTYPDSEYLAKAKLAIADSYFKEGGSTGLTQAVAEYTDFITFFPFLDEAAYAQMQIGMAHYRRMEKADRDRSEALEAEAAFQTFLQKYPHTELTPKAEQRLREIQEVLAEGDFRIASFYYIRHMDKASAPRLLDLVTRYPLYSAADRANWMLASIYERNEHNDVATTYYTRLVKEYPLSPLAAGAKAKLVKLGAPVPQPDPTAMARMQKEQQTPRDRPGLLKRPGELLKSGPDVSAAARVGQPTLTPQAEDATDTLTPGGGGLTVVAAGGASSGTNGSGTGAYVQTVTPGTSDPPPGAAGASANVPNAGAAAGSNDPTAAGASAQDGAGQSSQANPNTNGTGANGNADPPSQTSQSQGNQTNGQGESSSKKKKNKKQAQVQPQQVLPK
jgi:outer membrane protein assembly factor BamD